MIEVVLWENDDYTKKLNSDKQAVDEYDSLAFKEETHRLQTIY